MSDGKEIPPTRIALFQRKQVQRTIYNDDWWFVISDVVGVLSDSVDATGYIKDMRRCDPGLGKGWGQIATPLSIATSGGPQKVNRHRRRQCRRDLEQKSGSKVVTADNHLELTQSTRRLGQRKTIAPKKTRTRKG